jgi:hypothetical protein
MVDARSELAGLRDVVASVLGRAEDGGLEILSGISKPGISPIMKLVPSHFFVCEPAFPRRW